MGGLGARFWTSGTHLGSFWDHFGAPDGPKIAPRGVNEAPRLAELQAHSLKLADFGGPRALLAAS